MYFKRLVDLYYQTAEEYGHDKKQLMVSAHSWGWIGESVEEAKKDYFYPTKQMVDAIGRDRNHWSGMTLSSYNEAIGPNGAMFVGDSKTVAHKIISLVENLGLNRFMLHLPIGSMPHEKVLRAIELYGQEVAPIVRDYFVNKN